MKLTPGSVRIKSKLIFTLSLFQLLVLPKPSEVPQEVIQPQAVMEESSRPDTSVKTQNSETHFQPKISSRPTRVDGPEGPVGPVGQAVLMEITLQCWRKLFPAFPVKIIQFLLKFPKLVSLVTDRF